MSNGEKSSFGELNKFTKFVVSEKIPSWWKARELTKTIPKSSAFRRAH